VQFTRAPTLDQVVDLAPAWSSVLIYIRYASIIVPVCEPRRA
jgi:hypothetical protein